ncbi:hypothetical protein Cgig2_010444 [Carnegiea gigantea]|uniref:SWIM-type domain-containing protein n=1 Tax=Carnegiea gigantea TaxID=171969 RepID=A0A9Q1GU09_9CARY|nr:hypothetical protein Cgig2_010444 [Carnegiea gigantea]
MDIPSLNLTFSQYKFSVARCISTGKDIYREYEGSELVDERAYLALGQIETFRHKPIRVLLEAILAKRAEIAKEWTGRVVSKVTKQLLELELDSRTCRVTPAGMGEFFVQDGNTNFTIKPQHKPCDCMFWDISRIPCKHTIRFILRERLDPKARNLLKLGLPPVDKPGPGKPETSRRKDVTESKTFKRSSTIKCSKCGQYGHNSKSHKDKGGALALRSKKKRNTRSSKRKVRGRPSKDGRVTERQKLSYPPPTPRYVN